MSGKPPMKSSVARPDFDLKALYDALDAQRRSRGLSWTAANREINRFGRVATSTITSLRSKPTAEADSTLQMLLWLGRVPESFVPGSGECDAERFRLRAPGAEQILRWDTKALHSALDARRQARGMSWKEVAQEVGGCTPAMLTRLSKGGRTWFPALMRIVGWLDRPAATFTRVSDW